MIVKEVGGGISPLALAKLKQCHVKYVDLSGKGGLIFIAIENERRKRKNITFLTDLGLTTAEVLLAAQPYKLIFLLQLLVGSEMH